MFKNKTIYTPSSILEEDMQLISQANLPWDSLKDKTVLVSGASGMLASYMIEALLYMNEKKKLGVKILGLVRNEQKARERFKQYLDRNDLQIIHQDISQPFTIKEKIHCIIHAASQASPKYYGCDPVGTLSANVIGTYHLLELGKHHKIENFLYFSAGAVYGEISAEHIPTNETMYAYFDHLHLGACYSESKKMGETMCICYAHQFGFPVKIIRPYHVYGPGVTLDDGRSFSDFVADIIYNRDIHLFSDGETRRSFCYIADATIGFFSVLLKGKSREAYNLANPEAIVSILELAQRLIALFPEKKLKVIKKEDLKGQGYIPSTINLCCPDISKITKLGWQPKTSIEEGFKKTVRSFYEFTGI